MYTCLCTLQPLYPPSTHFPGYSQGLQPLLPPPAISPDVVAYEILSRHLHPINPHLSSPSTNFFTHLTSPSRSYTFLPLHPTFLPPKSLHPTFLPILGPPIYPIRKCPLKIALPSNFRYKYPLIPPISSVKKYGSNIHKF